MRSGLKSGNSMSQLDHAQQSDKAERFRALHRGPKVLVLPNAWDVVSARIFEEAGAAAIATTSAGVAFTLGYPDGEKISRDLMLAAVARIAAKVKVPVTADVESGYGDRPEDAAETARAVIEARAVGLNVEDAVHDGGGALVDLSLQLEKIAAIREIGKQLGVPLVVNARTTSIFSRSVNPKAGTTKLSVGWQHFGMLERIVCLYP